MFTTDEIRAEYAELDKKCGVDTSGIPIKISTRSVRRRGYCRFGRNGVIKYISFSDFIFDEAPESFWNTVRHEYAHVLVKIRHPMENHGHDAVWKAACAEVGCTGARCTPTTPEQKKRQMEKTKYTITCGGCGRTWNYSRKTKLIQKLQTGASHSYHCGLCGSKDFQLKQLR